MVCLLLQPLSRQHVVSLFLVFLCVAGLAYWRRTKGRGWRRSQIVWRRESMGVYRSFNTLWTHPMRKGCRRVISAAGEEYQSKIGSSNCRCSSKRSAFHVIKLSGHFLSVNYGICKSDGFFMPSIEKLYLKDFLKKIPTGNVQYCCIIIWWTMAGKRNVRLTVYLYFSVVQISSTTLHPHVS